MPLFFVVPNLLHGSEHLRVTAGRSRNDALVICQRPANAEVQRLALDIRHGTAGFSDNEVARRMIPYLLLVRRLDGQPQVDIAGAPRDRRVFGLRVQAHARVRDA